VRKERTNDGQQVKQADQFKYLESVISAKGYRGTEIRHWVALGKQPFTNKKKLFTGNLSIELKKGIVKSVLWRVVLYASETWSITQVDMKRLEAIEKWI